MNKRDIIYPYRGGVQFSTLEELRRAVADIEASAREMGVTGDEIFFGDTFCLFLNSEKLTDRSLVLNASISISQQKP